MSSYTSLKGLATASCLVLAVANAAAGPFDGKYRYNEHWDCSKLGQDGGAISISDTTYIGVEQRCTLTNPVKVRGMNATLYDAQCSAEGDSYQSRIMLLKSTSEKLYIVNEGSVSIWQKCPE